MKHYVRLLHRHFLTYYDEHSGTRIYFAEEVMPNLPNFEATFAKQKDWHWNFGNTPEFTHQIDERFIWGWGRSAL